MESNNLTCPNCGAPIDQDALKKLQCPYCSGSLESLIKKNAAKEGTSQKQKWDKITTFDAFEEAEEMLVLDLAYHCLEYRDVPKEVFNNLKIRGRKVYVPVWIFDGTFESNWQCVQVIEPTKPWETGDWTQSGSLAIDVRRIDRWKADNPPQIIPRQGVTGDSFKKAVSASNRSRCMENVGSDSFINYDPSLIDKDAKILGIDIERLDAWKRLCESPEMKNEVEKAVNDHMPTNQKELTYSTTYRQNKCVSLLCACWLLYFEYEGVDYTSLVSSICFDTRFPKLKKGGKEVNSIDEVINRIMSSENDVEVKVDLKPRIKLASFGWLCFIIFCACAGVFFWATNSLDNGMITCLLSALFGFLSIVFGAIMELKQREEGELIEKIDDKKRRLSDELSLSSFNSSEQRGRNTILDYILSTDYFSNHQNIKKEVQSSFCDDEYQQSKKKKSNKTISTLKKQLNELLETYHKRLRSDVRSKSIFALILVIGTILVVLSAFSSKASEEHAERIETERVAQEEFQKQQEEEQLQNEVAEKRNQLNNQINAVLDLISPQKLLTTDKNGCYQIRKDIGQVLLNLGFEKDDSEDANAYSYGGDMVKYHLRVDHVNDDGSTYNTNYMTAYIQERQSSSYEYRKSERISFHDNKTGENAFQGIIDRLVQQLKQDGFDVTKDEALSKIGNNPVYDCVKETTFEKEIDGNIETIKQKVAFKIKSSEVSVSISQDHI